MFERGDDSGRAHRRTCWRARGLRATGMLRMCAVGTVSRFSHRHRGDAATRATPSVLVSVELSLTLASASASASTSALALTAAAAAAAALALLLSLQFALARPRLESKLSSLTLVAQSPAQRGSGA